MATRWGIASAAKISNDFLCGVETLAKADHSLVAVGARNLADAQEFANRFGIPKAYGSYEELANDPDVEIVYIGTIHPFHSKLCKIMLEGNKHVLCEKPFSMNRRLAQEVFDIAEAKKLFIMEGYWSRFYPVYQRLREEIAKNTIGQVRVVSASFGFTADLENIPRLADKAMGGGALLDVGVYPVQMTQFVFNEKPEKIIATGTKQKTGADDITTAAFHYSGGRMATITCSLTTELCNTAFIQGTKGYIEIPMIWSPTDIIINGERTRYPLPKNERKQFFHHAEGFSYEAQHVRECLLKGLTESPVIPHRNTLELMGILDEIRQQIGLVYPQDEA